MRYRLALLLVLALPPAAAAARTAATARRAATCRSASRSTGTRTPTTWASTSASTAASSPAPAWTSTPRAPSDASDPITLVAAGRDRPRHQLRARGLLRPAAAHPGRRGGVGRTAGARLDHRRRAGAASTRRPTCAARRSAWTARAARPPSSTPCCAMPASSPATVHARATSASTRCPPCSSTRSTRSPACSRTSRGSSSRRRGLHPVVFPYDRYGVPGLRRAGAGRKRRPAALRRRLPAPGGAVRRGARSGHPLGAGPPAGRGDRCMEHHAYRDYQGTIRASVPATLALLRTGPLDARRVDPVRQTGCTTRAS